MTTTSSNTNAGGGIGFLGALTILFIGLKLTGYIGWSWWLVLLPLYGIPAVLLALALGGGVSYLVGLGVFKGVRAINRKRKHNALKKRRGL